ncbi:DUF1488 domain-containing protein [Oricola thermophila]|uniref:DUF1488 domain-containing protein n=1 Tax=Oricola thermophila TaxID=2742145 RepID=A0A6N1VDX6_9HYPH|nr:DUF1488 domain-containing protein [Oricola thermophila]QKV17359.1 DUF1488 domain-containing protein [Oricola thermophila]
MTLAFPNRSRNYDDTRRQVRFFGYEGMRTIPFRVDVDAIADQVAPDANEEAAYLAAFDRNRASIEKAASKAHSNSQKPEYILTSANFR